MRQIQTINDGWVFFHEDIGVHAAAVQDGEPVRLPHTWNGEDGQTGRDYYRGKCWYRRMLPKGRPSDDSRVYLAFAGVNACAEVYINRRLVVEHEGGYSSFRVDVTDCLSEQENILCVSADNAASDHVYPQFADFTFYGGIYRDVQLIRVEKEHFAFPSFGGKAIKVNADGEGNVTVTVWPTGGQTDIAIYDPDGNKIGQCRNGERFTVENARLWNGTADPCLYTAAASLTVDGVETDRVTADFGFRSFRVDADLGFILNGKPYPLRGVSRHQDRPHIGNAIARADHEEDMRLILELGANSIRLAHYQHDDYFYDLCDRHGLVAWSEIPYISQHLAYGTENAISQMQELISQTNNHPSVCFRSLSNEITMRKGDSALMAECHKALEKLCKEQDPDRLTTLALFSLTSLNHPIVGITDTLAHNIYYGWYSPFISGNGKRLDRARRARPDIPQGVSEFGADALPEIHSSFPVRGDCSEEYSCYFHEQLLKTVEKRPWLWCVYVWNMFDFGAANRKRPPEPGKNHKGLVTFDRKRKKDAFYLYKAHWSEEPFVHICGKSFTRRFGLWTTVKVYSNQRTVELLQDGRSLGIQTGDHVFLFRINLKKETMLEVRSGPLHDSTTIYRKWLPQLRRRGSTESWEQQ